LRAMADNISLAEVSGIDTIKSIRLTWAVAGALAGLAGTLYAAAIGSINPNFGVTILLSLFAGVWVDRWPRRPIWRLLPTPRRER